MPHSRPGGVTVSRGQKSVPGPRPRWSWMKVSTVSRSTPEPGLLGDPGREDDRLGEVGVQGHDHHVRAEVLQRGDVGLGQCGAGQRGPCRLPARSPGEALDGLVHGAGGRRQGVVRPRRRRVTRVLGHVLVRSTCRPELGSSLSRLTGPQATSSSPPPYREAGGQDQDHEQSAHVATMRGVPGPRQSAP